MRLYRRTCRSRRRVRVLLCGLLAVAITAGAVAVSAARAAPEPPRELWKQFPLNGQGTVPAGTTSGREKAAPAFERATPGELPSAGGESNLRWLIAVAVACLGIGLLSFVWLARVLWVERRVGATLMSEGWRERPSRTEDATVIPTENEQADDEAAPRSAAELIGIYSSSTASTNVESTDEASAPARHPPPSDATPVAEAAVATVEHAGKKTEAPEEQSQDEPGDLSDALTRMVGEQIAAARQKHHAFGLVAIEFEGTLSEAEPDMDQVRNQLDAALSLVLRSTERPEVVADPEERLVWLALPGLLRRRAAELASEVRPLLSERSLAPAAVAVSAYPRDGATAEELLANCHGKLETADARESVAE
jgi:hypothetical protein